MDIISSLINPLTSSTNSNHDQPNEALNEHKTNDPIQYFRIDPSTNSLFIETIPIC